MTQAALGELGEQLVAQWLVNQGWTICARRWRCCWGEIDLIARSFPQPPVSATATALIFVEVKTRSARNWDVGGLLAITAQKQQKLWRSAQLFLSQAPDLALLPCRFDVALVKACPLPSQSSPPFEAPPSVVALGQPIIWAGYQLTLQDYIPAAIEWAG